MAPALTRALVVAAVALSAAVLAGCGDNASDAGDADEASGVSLGEVTDPLPLPDPAAVAAVPPGVVPRAVPGETKVLLVGDSMAQALGFHQGATPGLSVMTAGVLGCGVARGELTPIGRPAPPARAECAAWPERWQASIERFAPDVSVVMVGAWEIVDRVVDGQALTVGSDAYAAYLARELDLGRRILTAGGRPMVLLTSPCFTVTAPGTPADWRERDDPARVAWVNEVLRAFADRHDDVTLVDLAGFVCPEGAYVGQRDGVVLSTDGTHLSATGAPLVWAWLTPQLQEVAAAG